MKVKEIPSRLKPIPVEELKSLLTSIAVIFEQIANSPELGYEAFLAFWNSLNRQKKELIIEQITDSLEFLIAAEDQIFSPFREIVCKAAIKFMNDDIEDKTMSPNLTLGKKYSEKQIAKMFYSLYAKKVINNKLEQVAIVISTVFDFKYSTILYYLKNPSEFEKTQDIFGSQ